MPPDVSRDMVSLAEQIRLWGDELGFQQLGISDTRLQIDETYLHAWLAAGHHGEMHYMARHGTKRTRPAELIPGTLRVISARMDYWTDSVNPDAVLSDSNLGYVARYALGRDYHKLIRSRLEKLARRIRDRVGEVNYRVFTDSAPIMEKALARNASLGWIGKHTNLIHQRAGSWFLLGEIYTDLPLPVTEKEERNLCGSCTACLHACPTQAFVGPYQLDARRCISYLTIEFRGTIPEALRSLIGNRVFGCDDCQLVCPWNRYAALSCERDFKPRHKLDAPNLLELFRWTLQEFNQKTLGSPIRRIGYEMWQRNLAVALGNSPYHPDTLAALRSVSENCSPLVREHIDWAVSRLLAHKP